MFNTSLPYLNVDLIWLNIFSSNYSNKNYKTNLFRSYFRISSTKKGFYFNFKDLNSNKNLHNMLKNSFLSGLKYI